MDLFVVNRYKGDNENTTKTEDDKLNKVLKKIKKRKITRERNNLKLKSRYFEEVKDESKTSEVNELTDLPEVALNKIDSNGIGDEKQVSDENEPSIQNDETQKIHESNLEDFVILGTSKFEKKQSVKRVLPKWLRQPKIISGDLEESKVKISRMDFAKELKQKLKEKHIKYMFPVQAEFIPFQLYSSKNYNLISPQDVCVSAPTGSGKTLTFTIPVLHHLIESLKGKYITFKAIRVLIVLPTQSLATQIYDTLKYYAMGTGIEIGIATGSVGSSLESEQHKLISHNSVWGTFSKVDILVCTPGRLVDHLKSTAGFNLKHLQYVIIDEADRVLNSVQDDWLYNLKIHLNLYDTTSLNHNFLNLDTLKKSTPPQKLLFSATLSQDPEKLQKLSLFQPKLFTCGTENQDDEEESYQFVGKYTTPSKLTEKYIICTIETRPIILYKIILDQINNSESPKILVFANTVETLHRLYLLLKFMAKDIFVIAEMSSSLGALAARKELLAKFENGKIQVLVCTDSMARGIDIPNVDCVISYSVPNHIKTYIHRAGRTARAGCHGLCISMLHAKQQSTFLHMMDKMTSHTNPIEKFVIMNDDLKSLTPLYEESLGQLKEIVTNEMQTQALRLRNGKKITRRKKAKKYPLKIV